MFLAVSFTEMPKCLHVHQKVTLTLPTKQRKKIIIVQYLNH